MYAGGIPVGGIPLGGVAGRRPGPYIYIYITTKITVRLRLRARAIRLLRKSQKKAIILDFWPTTFSVCTKT